MPKGYPIHTSNLTHPLISKGNIRANAKSLGFTLPPPKLISKAQIIPLYVTGVCALLKGTHTTPDDLAPSFPLIPSSVCASLGITFPHDPMPRNNPLIPTTPNFPSATCTDLGITYPYCCYCFGPAAS